RRGRPFPRLPHIGYQDQHHGPQDRLHCDGQSGPLAHGQSPRFRESAGAEIRELARIATRSAALAADRLQNTAFQLTLGGALLGRKDCAEAGPLLLAGYEGMKQREAAIPEQAKARLPEALDRLIESYTATNKPDEVTRWPAERAKYP